MRIEHARAIRLLVLWPVMLATVDHSTAQPTGSLNWQSLPDMPVPRRKAGTAVLANECFVVGGLNRAIGRKIDQEVLTMDLDGEWTSFGELTRPFSSPFSAIIDDNLYVAGGSLDGANPQAGVWVADLHSLPATE